MVIRASFAGFVTGMIGLAGSRVVVGVGAGGAFETAILAAAILVALAAGIWAGAPETLFEGNRLRDRWLSASAFTAVAGAFGTFSNLYQQVYPGRWWVAGALLLGLALPVYAVGLLVPALLAWADELHDALAEDGEGRWGGLGPVVLGMVGGAAGGVLVAGMLALPRLSPGSVLMLTALVLLVPMAMRDSGLPAAREVLLFETVTPFGDLRVTEVVYPADRQPERRLYLNGEEESGELARSGTPTLGYIAAAESWLNTSTPVGSEYLFLGGGAYTLPRRIVERDPRARVTVVELDPAVTSIAHHFFGLARHHPIATVHGDGRAFLDHASERRFDRIYVDVYAGNESLPFSLVTVEAARALRERLNPGGVAALNVIGNTVSDEKRRLWSVVRTFAGAFPSVALYVHLDRDFAERQNFLLAGAAEPDHRFPASAGPFALWPHAEWPELEGVVTYRDLEVPSIPDRQAIGAGRHERQA